VTDRQDVRKSTQGWQYSRVPLGQAAESSRYRALHHPHLRLSVTRRQSASGSRALCEHRTISGTCASHALAHVYARRPVEGISRSEQSVDEGCIEHWLYRRNVARRRLCDVCLSADGEGFRG